jgi:hypothetical protein
MTDPDPRALAQEQTRRVRDGLLRERLLYRQLQGQASTQLLGLLASRLNALLAKPCSECDPTVCPGGPALCVLALSERLEADTERDSRVQELEELTTNQGIDKARSAQREASRHDRDVALGDFLVVVEEAVRAGGDAALMQVKDAFDAYRATVEAIEDRDLLSPQKMVDHSAQDG